MDILYIHECAQWIISNNFSKVGLEFPDDPKMAVTISRLLKKAIGFSPIVLQDSNRACGNCCVDERTAKPRDINAIIHFGRTCLSPTQALPVLYVLSPHITIDSEGVINSLLTDEGPKESDDLILVYDVLCTPSIDLVSSQLNKFFPSLLKSNLIIPEQSKLIYHESNLLPDFSAKVNISDSAELQFNSRQIYLPPNKSISDYNFIYIGPSSPTLVALQMRFSDKVFYTINPNDNKLLVSNFVKVVMSRSRKIEQVKDSKTVGLISTIVKGHQEILLRLKKLIKSSNKKCYSFFMGKINEAKLANIVGIDVFVYIGCPESSIFDRIEHTYLYKNIVTPWEVEVALNPSIEWSLNFETNFREFLKTEKYAQDFAPNENEEFSEEITNSLEDREAEQTSALVERKPGTLYKLHENGAGEALFGLSWQGLNPNAESSVSLGMVVEGRKGIALEYDTDRRNEAQ